MLIWMKCNLRHPIHEWQFWWSALDLRRMDQCMKNVNQLKTFTYYVSKWQIFVTLAVNIGTNEVELLPTIGKHSGPHILNSLDHAKVGRMWSELLNDGRPYRFEFCEGASLSLSLALFRSLPPGCMPISRFIQVQTATWMHANNGVRKVGMEISQWDPGRAKHQPYHSSLTRLVYGLKVLLPL